MQHHSGVYNAQWCNIKITCASNYHSRDASLGSRQSDNVMPKQTLNGQLHLTTFMSGLLTESRSITSIGDESDDIVESLMSDSIRDHQEIDSSPVHVTQQ